MNNTLAKLTVFTSLALTQILASAQTSGHWVESWSAACHTPIDLPGVQLPLSFQNETLRMVIRPTLGGDRLRVRLSNTFGTTGVKIGDAHMALLDQGSKIVASTDRVLTFSGEHSIVIPPGAVMLSDPVTLTVPPMAELAISIYLPDKTPAKTLHLLGQHETFEASPGDLTGSLQLGNAKATRSWYFLSGLEMWSSPQASTLVTFGDSITDGFGATPGEYRDWPDQLLARLRSSGDNHTAVVNEGIGGNRILFDGMGVNALARLDRDVIAQPGVSRVILLEGINDIGWPHMPRPTTALHEFANIDLAAQDVTPADLIAGMKQIIERVHEHGIRIYGATILPFEGSNTYSEEGETTRQAVNQWIRSGGQFDGVIDFDRAISDPADPRRMREDLQSGDHLHPNNAGYKVMADAIDLSLIEGNGN